MCSSDFFGSYSTFQALYLSSLYNNVFFFFFLFEVAVDGGPLASSFSVHIGSVPGDVFGVSFHSSSIRLAIFSLTGTNAMRTFTRLLTCMVDVYVLHRL